MALITLLRLSEPQVSHLKLGSTRTLWGLLSWLQVEWLAHSWWYTHGTWWPLPPGEKSLKFWAPLTPQAQRLLLLNDRVGHRPGNFHFDFSDKWPQNVISEALKTCLPSNFNIVIAWRFFLFSDLAWVPVTFHKVTLPWEAAKPGCSEGGLGVR